MPMPSAVARACVSSDVATQVNSSPACTLGPNKSTNFAAVVPVPRPSFMPDSTYCSERAAAAIFCSSLFMPSRPVLGAPRSSGVEYAIFLDPFLRQETQAQTIWPLGYTAKLRPPHDAASAWKELNLSSKAAHQCVLDLDELFDAVVRTLTPDPAFLEAAKGSDLS